MMVGDQFGASAVDHICLWLGPGSSRKWERWAMKGIGEALTGLARGWMWVRQKEEPAQFGSISPNNLSSRSLTTRDFKGILVAGFWGQTQRPMLGIPFQTVGLQPGGSLRK